MRINSQVETAVADPRALEKWEPEKPPSEPEELESKNTKRTARDGKTLVTGKLRLHVYLYVT